MTLHVVDLIILVVFFILFSPFEIIFSDFSVQVYHKNMNNSTPIVPEN